jgi:hypothetical protein
MLVKLLGLAPETMSGTLAYSTNELQSYSRNRFSTPITGVGTYSDDNTIQPTRSAASAGSRS